MIDTKNTSAQFEALSSEFFSNLQYQKDDPDKFTAVRRSVISFVEKVPQKSCDNGWTYDHSLVFNTITSEVSFWLCTVTLSSFLITQNNWVCQEDFRPMLIQTVFWVGNTLGCFLWGFTND